MLKKRRELESHVQEVIDLFLLMGCMYAAHTVRRYIGAELSLRPSMIFRENILLAFAAAAIGHFSLKAQGFYSRPVGGSPGRTFWDAARGMGICVLVVLACLFVANIQDVNRATLFMFGVFGAGAVWVSALVWQHLVVVSASLRHNRRVAVLVGSPAENHESIAQIQRHPEWAIEVLGQINLNVQTVEDLGQLLREQPVDLVIFTAGKSYLREVESAILACEVEGVEAWLVADFIRTSISQTSLDELMGKPMLVFRSAPEVSWPLLFKGVFDRVMSGALIVLLLPVGLVIALLIKLTSPGPVFFCQERCALRGRVFMMYKFRSMVSNAEQLQEELVIFNEMDGPVFKIAKDPRITWLGRFLRRTSLDELPQLLNVFQGAMSLVGPRPLPVYEVKKFTDPWQRRRLSMKPGITCLWQIAGRNKVGFEEWMRLDLVYIDNWSLWLDLRILLKTVPVVLLGRGAH
ncbi:MAG: sugar transferase [Verrucomicrobia bacterium]|nr:sugar transferase [Verrucomicrobiota bacterium]